MSLNDINNLSYAKWNYKYHIVFGAEEIPKKKYSTKKSGQ